MQYEYYFCARSTSQLIEYLKSRRISYKTYAEASYLHQVVFRLKSGTRNVDSYINDLEKLGITPATVSAAFSKAELAAATYLMLIPKKQCVEITNTEDACQSACDWITSVGVEKSGHEEQIGLFRIRRIPSQKNKTAFWCEETGWSYIFTDRRVYDLAKNNSLKGVMFQNVLLKDGTISTEIFQLISEITLPRKAVKLGYGEVKSLCPICGREQYYINDAYQLNLDLSCLSEECDLLVTEKMFGEGIAYPIYIISKKFYRLLQDADLCGGLRVVPVVECHDD